MTCPFTTPSVNFRSVEEELSFASGAVEQDIPTCHLGTDFLQSCPLKEKSNGRTILIKSEGGS
jgi:hypothetical protein